MNQLQINAINRAVTSLRELELDLIVDMSVDSLHLAQYINESCNKIESSLYTDERAELISLEYASAFNYYPEDRYQEIVDQQLIEVWVDGLSNHQVELALQFKQL